MIIRSAGRALRALLRLVPRVGRGRAARAIVLAAPPSLRATIVPQLVGLLGEDDHLPVVSGALAGAAWLPASSISMCLLGTFSPESQQLFTEFVRPGDVVWDVGANVGFFTVLAGRLVEPEGRVISFEPLPRAAEYLRRHVALNGLENVRVIEAAVGANTGPAQFEPSSSLAMGHLDAAGSVTVEVVRLDDVDDRLPTFVKIDVEGGEEAVLAGACKLLRVARPTLLVAVHGETSGRACRRLLSETGYEVTTAVDDGGSDESRRVDLLARPV